MTQNINGKSLEYIIAKALCSPDKFNNVDCFNYKEKYDSLSKAQMVDYDITANIIKLYYASRCDITDWDVSFNTDVCGTKGDSSDIVVGGVTKFGISIKNTKSYIKSQRPSGLPTQCGIRSVSDMGRDYISKYTDVCNKFYISHINYSYFRDIDKKHIHDLYSDINMIVIDFLTKLKMKNMVMFFEFIYSNNVQIINTKKSVIIYDFTKRKIPTTCDISINRGRVELKYNTGLVVLMRLHTASSRLTKNLSLKYDTTIQKYEPDVKRITLDKKSISNHVIDEKPMVK